MCNTVPQPGLEQAEAVLQQRLNRRVVELRLLQRQGGVILRGYAFSYHAKQLAQHAAMHLLGLRVLVNEIEVRQVPPGQDAGGSDPD
jgi:hypothetical protein